MKKKLLYILIIVFFVSGYFLGYFIKKNPSENLLIRNEAGQKNYQNTFDDGWAAARQKLIDSGFIMIFENNVINGQIEKVSDDKIIFSANLFGPLDDEILKKRTAIINSETEVIIKRLRTAEENKTYEQEKAKKIQALEAKKANTKSENEKMEIQMEIDMASTPSIDMYIEEKAKISDFKVGFNIRIEAREDISQMKEFIAFKIIAEENSTNYTGNSGANNVSGDPPPPVDADLGASQDTPPPPVDADLGASQDTPPPPVDADLGANQDTPPPPLPAE